MNRPASNDLVDDDEIRGWIAEAGDFRVVPRLEHVEHVRQGLLERVVRPREEVAIPPEEVETPLGIGLARVFAVTCLVAAAIFGAVYLLPRGGDAWASVAQVLQEKAWIHCVTTGLDGFRQETWFSPRFEILAMKCDSGAEQSGAEFHDLAADIKTEYVAEENTIYRRLESEGIPTIPINDLDFFHHFRRGADFKVSPYPDSEIVGQSHREVVDQGKIWKLHELTIRGTSNRKFQVKMIVRVDPASGLPRTWDVEGQDDRLQQVLDYPTIGPLDILGLGVPSTAKRVDKVPFDDVDQVLNHLKIGRDRFDDYCAYVWFEKTVNRVWRKGRRWRVELVMPQGTAQPGSSEPDQIPDDAGLDWWKEHEPQLLFRPEAICDGRTILFYHYKPREQQRDQANPWEQESVSSQYFFGTADDPPMPWPHLMPEQVGHTRIGTPDRNWEFFVDLKPDDGPPNTVRLRVRHVLVDDPKQPDVYRLWIDPRKNDVVLRRSPPSSNLPRPHRGPADRPNMPTSRLLSSRTWPGRRAASGIPNVFFGIPPPARSSGSSASCSNSIGPFLTSSSYPTGDSGSKIPDSRFPIRETREGTFGIPDSGYQPRDGTSWRNPKQDPGFPSRSQGTAGVWNGRSTEPETRDLYTPRDDDHTRWCELIFTFAVVAFGTTRLTWATAA